MDEAAQRARLAELQRRLYRPDASADDRERYVRLRDELAEVGTIAAPPARGTEHAPAPPASGRPLLPGLVLGVVALGAAVALLQAPGGASAPVATASDGGTPRAGPEASGVSRRFSDDAPAPPVSRTVEVAVDGGTVLAQRFAGTGPADVSLITGGAPLDGGRLIVRLVPTGPADVSWQAEAVSPALVPAAPVSADSATVRYRDAPPRGIRVGAPAGVDWTLTVAFAR